MTLKAKIILVAVFALAISLFTGGRWLYNKGFEDATTHWQQESNKKLSELASKKDKERAELEAKLVADFSHDLRLRDERLLEFENFVRANRDRECSADERNAIIRVAIGFEEVAVKAIRLLEAERKN